MAEEKKTAYLTGRLLLAMPGIGDPRFQKAVVIMCTHDRQGAMGLVLNRTLPGLDFSDLLTKMGIEIGGGKAQAAAAEVMSGGPVEAARGFILHSGEFSQPDTIRISDDFSITGTIDALRAIADGTGPDPMKFILGYAGWGKGQLDEEIRQNVWLVTDADPGLVFSVNHETMWEQAVRMMGVDPAMLSDAAGRA